MEYTGKYYSKNTTDYGLVNILEYRSDSKYPYCECSKCGKDIKRLMYVVQSPENDTEIAYLGADCVQKLK